MRSRAALAAVAVTAAATWAMGPGTPALAAPVGSLPHRAALEGLHAVQPIPAVPLGASPTGPLPSHVELSMRVVLQPRNPVALSAFVAATSNPSSPTFRRFLPRGEFARRFGPTSEAIRSVRTALGADGLTVTSVSESHLVLVVRGTAGRFTSALHAGIERWRLHDGAHGYRLVRAARLPSSVARYVAGVVGVSSLVAERSFALQPPALRTGAQGSTRADRAERRGAIAPRGKPSLQPQTCSAASTAIENLGDGTFTPTEEGDAYGLSAAWDHGYDGTGHTVALLEFAPYSPSDILAYDKCFQLLAQSATHDPDVHNINVDGGTSPGSSVASDEPTLDIEELRALAPGARIDVYQGPNNVTGPLDTLQRIATDDTAQAVSISWGICEAFSDHAAETPVFEQLAAQGQTVFAASGDNGSSDCLGQSPPTGKQLVAAAVDDPGSQPLVTDVGGLTVDSLAPLEQSVWNDCVSFDQPGCLGGAGGGGISAVYPRPAWQQAPGAPSGTARGARARLVPDLSVMGDPSTGMLVYFEGSYQAFGGTSMGAPLVAAIDVVAAQSCSDTTLGFLNPLLYAMGRHGGDFDDVTAGNNAIATSTLAAHEYDAGPGFDMASGLGSPDPTTFLPALCNGPATAVAAPTAPSATATWTVQFHTGSTAYPVGTTVTVTAPPDTMLPPAPAAWSVETSDGTHAPTSVSVRSQSSSRHANVATLTLAQGATAVDDVTITASGVTNPPIVGSATVSVTDSVDALSSTAPLALDAAAPAAGHGVVSGARTAVVGGPGATVHVLVRDAGDVGVSGATITATASAHGRAIVLAHRTDDRGVATFVVRDEHAERLAVTVQAGGVVVGRETVTFTDPWHTTRPRVAALLPRVLGTPGVTTASSGGGEVVLARTATGALVVGTVAGARLLTATLPSTFPGAASSPALARVGTTLYAAYRAPNGDLVELHQHAGSHLTGWHATDLTAARVAPRVTGDPRLVVVGTGASARVSIASVSIAHHVVRTSARLDDAGRFSSLDLTHAASVAPTATGDVAEVELGTSDEFVYRTIEGSIEMLAVEGGRWAGNDVPSSAMLPTLRGDAIASSPAAVVAAGVVTVAAETVGGRTDLFVGTFDAWSGQTIGPGPMGASAPQGLATLPRTTGTPALVVRGATTQVFCPTTSGALLELTSLGVEDPWAAEDVSTLAHSPKGLAGLALLDGRRPVLVGSFDGRIADVVGGIV